METTPTDQKDLLSFTMYRHSEPPKRPAKKEIKQKWRDTLHSKRFLFLPNGGDALSSTAPAKTRISKRNQSQLYARSFHQSMLQPLLRFRLLNNGCLTTATTTSTSTTATTITTRRGSTMDWMDFFKFVLLPFSRGTHTQSVYQLLCYRLTIHYWLLRGDIDFFGSRICHKWKTFRNNLALVLGTYGDFLYWCLLF